MKERIITAVLVIAVLVGIVFFVPVLFIPTVAAMLGIALWEWCSIAKIRRPYSYGLATATVLLWLAGLLNSNAFTVLMIFSVVHYLLAIRFIWEFEHIRNFRIHRSYLILCAPVVLSALATVLVYIFNPLDGNTITDDAMSLIFVIMVIAAADSGAYFVGKFFGKHPLCPRVSPKKTIEGLVGGLLSVAVVVYCFDFMVEQWYLSTIQLLCIALSSAVFSVIGDLFISIIKRQNNIKDSGQLFPGHGGVLDRIDGLLAGVPVFYLLQQWI